MKEKQRKIMGLIISFVMIITIMPQTIWASDAGTREDAVKWVYAQEGKFLDYDKVYGAQCVDLVHYYYAYFGKASYATGNGCDFVNNKLPDGWTRIKNTPDFVPQPGDIAVWGKELSQYGHVAIILSADAHSFVSMDQNWPRGSACKKVTHNYNKFWGVIRPNFSEPPSNPPTYSNFWVDHYLFDLSETVSFTAVASGADNYTIGIDKNGVGRVVTEGCGSTYTISADRLGAGEYSAYMTVANSAGYVDTYRVYFVVAEKCNFGDKFSARIKNIGTGCYITNKDSKIVGTPESGYNNQIWFFNKYSDGSYTIMSQLDGLMMDVSYIDDPPAGADVHAWESTGKWNQRFNIYYLDDAFYIRPANTKTLVVDMGAGEPYNVACYNLSRNAGQQKYRFDMVGMGDYIPYGLGDEFYAQLRCQGTNLYVTNQNGNVAGAAATADDSQIWKFMRQSNGAYVIQNTLDGSYIDVENSNDANKTNFLSYNEYTGNRNQQFYFYEMDNAFYIKPLISNTRVMDMQSTAPYNVALWDKGNDWGPQKFDVIKVSHSDDNMSKPVETSYFKGHKYELYNESMTWESAKLFCEKKGGHLVTISDEKENEFVNGMRCRNLSTDYQQSIWLGGSDTANEGTWSWITGESFTYSNWEPNEPNGGNSQNYLQMYSSGNWDDVQNEAGRFVVCEYDSVQPKLTPVASSLSLSDNIGFNIYMQISDDVLSDDGAMMIITNSDGKVIKKPISSYETTTYQDKPVKK